MDQLPPPLMLWSLINTHTIARCLHVVAEAGVADALDDRPKSAAELAAATGLNADALGRILRLLAANGVFAAGANVLVAGSAVFSAPSPAESYRELTAMVAAAGEPAWA